ncbi:ORF6N domain-containing protein [Niastella populi]|uniref:ORF6N domain-containing protein n=1 Tax=Niastella populi TaxID=550983 RepID=UPI001F610CC7|nr:ORF6N domain-containing protein [Niastella populi]
MEIIQSIQNRIYEIRGERVMLDRDLAALYDVETRIFNQSVKRNGKRFPADFMLTNKRRMGKCKIADGEFTEKYDITICDDIPRQAPQ